MCNNKGNEDGGAHNERNEAEGHDLSCTSILVGLQKSIRGKTEFAACERKLKKIDI
jgi:hypothetical protein